MRVVADFHLRCFYFSYYTLESAMTLILAALAELSDCKSEEEDRPKTIADVACYLNGAHRARRLLKLILSDSVTACPKYSTHLSDSCKNKSNCRLIQAK